MLARLVAIEGPDKVGKRTQSEALVRALRERGLRAVRVEVPFDDGTTHRLIYRMLRTGSARRYPGAFQFVHFLNKLAFQVLRLPWLRLRNDFVVLDRWALSAVVYGEAAGVPSWFNRALHALLVRPSMTIVLDGDAFPRPGQVDDSHERDDRLQRSVRRLYVSWASAHPADHRVVGSRAPVAEVTQAIIDEVVPGCRTRGAKGAEPCDGGMHA